MSFEKVADVIASDIKGSTDTLVMVVLANYACDEKNMCWPSTSAIAKKCRMSERSVNAAIKRLEKAGWLEIYHGGGRRVSNIYYLKVPVREKETPQDLRSIEEPHTPETPQVLQKTPQNLHKTPQLLQETPQNLRGNKSESIKEPVKEPIRDRAREESAVVIDHEPQEKDCHAEAGYQPGNDPEVHAHPTGSLFDQPGTGSGVAGDDSGGQADRRPATAAAKPKRPAKRRQQFPEDWWPNDKGVQYALDVGCPDVAENVAACIDKHNSAGNTHLDFELTWRTWCRNARDKYGWHGSRQGAKVLPGPGYHVGHQAKSTRGQYLDRLLAASAKAGAAGPASGDGGF